MVNKGKYVAPWSRQAALKKAYRDDEIPEIKELSMQISEIKCGKTSEDYQTLRARALFAMYYLTGCRVSEITMVDSLRKQRTRKEVIFDHDGTKKVVYSLDADGEQIVDKKEIRHEFVGIRKKDITFTEIDGHKCMIIRTENRKNRMRKTKRLPIPIEKEKEIAKFIYEYIKKLEPESILFPFKSKRATQIINETTGFNVHFIRHIRATHLVTKYDYNEQALVKFMGWTNSMPAKHYMELKSSDIFRQFYKGG